MTLNERIKKLRKSLDLTQQEFAQKIGTTANVLTNYETGRRNPSSSVINNICKTFNVSEEWLRTGSGGKMFVEPVSFSLDKYAAERGATELELAIAKAYFDLPQKVRAEMLEALRAIFNSAGAFDSTQPNQENLEKEADEFAATAREQFLMERKQASSASFAKESDVG